MMAADVLTDSVGHEMIDRFSICDALTNVGPGWGAMLPYWQPIASC